MVFHSNEQNFCILETNISIQNLKGLVRGGQAVNKPYIYLFFFGSINTVSFLCVRSQLTEMTSCNSNENNVL